MTLPHNILSFIGSFCSWALETKKEKEKKKVVPLPAKEGLLFSCSGFPCLMGSGILDSSFGLLQSPQKRKKEGREVRMEADFKGRHFQDGSKEMKEQLWGVMTTS